MKEFLDVGITIIGVVIVAIILWGMGVALWMKWRMRGK